MAKASHIFSTKIIRVFGYKVVKYLTSWPLNELVKLTMLWTTGPWCWDKFKFCSSAGTAKASSMPFLKTVDIKWQILSLIYPYSTLCKNLIANLSSLERSLNIKPVIRYDSFLQWSNLANKCEINIKFKLDYGWCLSGPGCSKLTTLLVNVSLKFQMLISEICQYFLLKKCEKLLHCKSFSHFFSKKYQCIWLSRHKTLNKLTS